jgi:membrane protein DedA with SNARE-associated domain
VTIEQVVAQYGYLALVVGTSLEGETVLIVAGFAAHQGYLKLAWVILAAFIGSLTGDQLYFLLGRLKGRPFLQSRPAWQVQAHRVEHLLDSHGTWIMLGFRFMYGLRTITPFVIGTSSISMSRFITLNAAGALAWAIASVAWASCSELQQKRFSEMPEGLRAGLCWGCSVSVRPSG